MLLLVATPLVYRLADQNDELVQRLTNLREATRKPLPGYAVPTFTAPTLEGDTVTVGQTSPGQRQLLFVFTTTCPYCQATLPAWKHLASRVQADPGLDREVEVLGISKDSLAATRAYRHEHDLEFPILQFPRRKLVRLYRGGAVPLTMILDADGVVEYSRIGQIDLETAAMDSVVSALRSPPARLGDPRPRTDSPSARRADNFSTSATGGSR